MILLNVKVISGKNYSGNGMDMSIVNFRMDFSRYLILNI